MELLVKSKFDELYNLAVSKNYNEENLKLLETGFLFAEEKHRNQKRKSGEPYIIHPLSTAILLVEWNMDIETVVAGLLHDVIEDCDVNEEEMILLFGINIYNLVRYVTKVSGISKTTRQEMEKNLNSGIPNNDEYTVKVFLSMSKDLRAMIVKLADRLHNIRTIGALKPEKQQRIANETFTIYANIAGRLGMYEIKTELLDRSFQILHPQKYADVLAKINRLRETNDKPWNDMISKLENLLKISNLNYQLKLRIKGVYSTYKKMQKGIEIKDIHDIFATRLIVNSPIDCYHALGLVHLNFVYLKNAFKDYISRPKANLYQSIHTTVVINNVLFEIQIRDEQMDLFATYGVAAHWKYKESNKAIDAAISQVATTAMLRDFNSSKDKSINTIKSISTQKIFDVLLLNDNEWYAVTNNTTILDVAYRFDPKKLPYLMTAYLNGQKATFDQKLESGDTIKLSYTEVYPMIKTSWINIVTNYAAKTFIKDFIAKHELYTPKLEKFFEKLQKKLGNQRASDHEIYKRLKEEFNYNSINQWWELVSSCKNLKDKETKQMLYDFFSLNREKYLASVEWIKQRASNWIIGSSYFEPIPDVYFNKLEIPNCCVKLPGIEIIGILKQNVLKVHNTNCPKTKIKSSKKIVMAWNELALANHPRKFNARIKIGGPWTETVGNRIAKILDNKKSNIASIIINKFKNNLTYDGEIIAYFRDINHLNNIMLQLESDDIISKFQIA